MPVAADNAQERLLELLVSERVAERVQRTVEVAWTGNGNDDGTWSSAFPFPVGQCRHFRFQSESLSAFPLPVGEVVTSTCRGIELTVEVAEPVGDVARHTVDVASRRCRS